MRKTLLRTLVVVVVVSLVGAGAAQALKLRIGEIIIVGDGGFSTLRWNGQGGGPALTLLWPLKGNSP